MTARIALQVHKSPLTIFWERSNEKIRRYLDHPLQWSLQIIRPCALLRYVDQLVKHRKINFLLATPVMPTLQVSVIKTQNGEEHVIMKCSTVRTKPPPRITWLLGDGMELYGKWRNHSLFSFVFLPIYIFKEFLKCSGTLWWLKVPVNPIQYFIHPFPDKLSLLTSRYYALFLKASTQTAWLHAFV